MFYQILISTFTLSKRILNQEVMKSMVKLMIYSVVVVSLCVFITLLFKNHPEVQLSFLVPGIFIFIYSKIHDEVYRTMPGRFRIAKGR